MLAKLTEAERQLLVAREELELSLAAVPEELIEYRKYTDRTGAVLRYRRAYFEVNGSVAPGAGLPSAKAWPLSGDGVSYRDKLVGRLPPGGRAAEIGPLNIPLLDKAECSVLYVDHLDTEGLKSKYQGLEGIVPIDRPMVGDSIAETLKNDFPIDYICASQVMEHVPNPIRWLNEVATTLRVGGLCALSLPDRRWTFDFFRDETKTADIVASYFADSTVPDVRAVYDNQLLATTVNMHWSFPESLYPSQIVEGRGAVSPRKVADDHMSITRVAHSGEYLDAHVSVFTDVGFLLTMADLAGDGLIPFRCHQFYPTDDEATDRGNGSFTIVLEKTGEGVSAADRRLSFLKPLD